MNIPVIPERDPEPRDPVPDARWMPPRDMPGWWSVVERQAASVGVSPRVLYSLANVESSFNENAQNPRSSAQGIFQIIDSTWQRLAQQYPELNLTNKLDPYQQALAAPILLRDKANELMRRTGKTSLTAGEQYMAWFFGAGGAARILNADPSTPIEQLTTFGTRIANPGILSPDHLGRQAIRTAGDALEWASRKMGEPIQSSHSPAPEARPYLDFAGAQPADPVPFRLQEKIREDEEESALGFWGALRNSSQIDTVVGQLWLDRNRDHVVDPEYRFEDVKRDVDLLLKDRRNEIPGLLSQTHYEYLYDARSQDDLLYRWERLKTEYAIEQELIKAGFTGIAARFIAAALDPAALAAGFGLGKALQLSNTIRRLHAGSRLSRGLAFGGEAAAANVALDAVIADRSAVFGPDTLIYSAAGGFILGGALGAATGRSSPLGREATERIAEIAARAQREAQARSEANLAGTSVDEPSASSMPRNVEAFSVIAENARHWNREDLGIVETAMPMFQYGTARHTASINDIEAAFMSQSVVDAVGPKDKFAVANQALETLMLRMERHYATRLERALDETWRDYRKRHNLNPYTSLFDGQKRAFNEAITEAVWDRSGREFDPAVSKAAAEIRQIYSEFVDLMRGDHRALFGDLRKPLPGTEDLQKNPNYMARIYNREAYNRWLGQIGDENMRRFWREAFRASNRDMEERLLVKWADSFHNRLKKLTTGVDHVHLDNAYGGKDYSRLRSMLSEDGWSQEEINELIAALRKPRQEEGPVRYTKHRANYDENFSMEFTVNGQPVRLSAKDLLIRDAQFLVRNYIRTMSGVLAMSRLRIKNPMFAPDKPEMGPEFLVDGITTEGEWKRLLEMAAHVGHAKGQTADQIKASLTRMQWVYDRIMGRPDRFTQDHPKLAQWVRIVRDLNFMRVMNQVGFAQVAEVGMVLSEFGYRVAAKSLPVWRDIVRNRHTGKYDDVVEELVWIFSPGTDDIRALGYMIPENLNEPSIMTTGSFGDRVEAIVRQGTRITSHISGMSAINKFLQRWAGKAALYKFIEAARRGDHVLNKRRLRVLGLGDEDIAKILEHLKPKSQGGKASYVLDDVSGKRLRTLNLREWDPEVLAKFSNALFMWTRKVVQEGDLGQSNMFLGHTISKLFFQFRTFMLASWAKNTLHNFNMNRGGFDPTTVHMIIMTSFFAGVSYYAQTYLMSIGMDRYEREKFFDLRFGKNNEKLYAAAFHRASYASIFPFAYDNALALPLGLDPLFDQARVSGLPSQGILSFPTASLYDNLVRAMSGSTRAAFTDAEMDKKTLSAIQGTMVFGNALPMVWLFNSIKNDLPETQH